MVQIRGNVSALLGKWVTCLSGPCAEKEFKYSDDACRFLCRNNDSVLVMSLVQNAKGDAALCEECRESHADWCFYLAGFWSWRAVASAAKCVFTTVPKANRPTLRCSLTAWLMTSGTRCLWLSVPLMSYYMSTATGKMLRMNIQYLIIQ